ncbi:hypothetical protein EJB05_50715, partial [Eragrostis curvula]
MAAASRALLLLLLPWVLAGSSSIPLPPHGPVQCSVCTVTNAVGSFNDRKTCYAGSAVYPRTEAELVAAVARAVKEKRKAGVPGGSVIISTARLDRVVRVDAGRRQMTVQSGVLLRNVIREAGAVGMALPNSPYFYGVTVGGLLATGAHGSSLMGKGGAVHEYRRGARGSPSSASSVRTTPTRMRPRSRSASLESSPRSLCSWNRCSSVP